MKLILFVVPLGLDTFAVSAALGLAGLPARARLRVSVLMSAFEMVMPLVGLLLGRGLGSAIGSVADYLAIAVLAAVGVWMLLEHDQGEADRVTQLDRGHLLTTLALGLSISLDELAIGFTIGLLHLTIWIAVALIGLQAFLFAQIGLRVGARLGERARENAERLAGIALFGLSAYLLIEKLS